jgi:hypothetical protein
MLSYGTSPRGSPSGLSPDDRRVFVWNEYIVCGLLDFRTLTFKFSENSADVGANRPDGVVYPTTDTAGKLVRLTRLPVVGFANLFRQGAVQ